MPESSGAEDVKGSKQKADIGSCVVGLSAGAARRDCPLTWVGWESALALRGSTASCVQGKTRHHALWVANNW